MAKHHKHIFNITAIENKTGIRKLKLNEFVLGKVSMSEAEINAVIKLVLRETRQFLQNLDMYKNESI
jgi:hypothetical protein